jgi:putative membrane protein
VTTDAWLAIGHHLAVFGLLAVLAAEWALVQPGMTPASVQRLGRIDIFYGVFAVAVLVLGIARLAAGDLPFDFYAENPFFWLKMAAFATVGVLSAGPTMRYLRWGRALAADPGAVPADAELEAVRRALLRQLGVFPVIPICAALMARGIGA